MLGAEAWRVVADLGIKSPTSTWYHKFQDEECAELEHCSTRYSGVSGVPLQAASARGCIGLSASSRCPSSESFISRLSKFAARLASNASG